MTLLWLILLTMADSLHADCIMYYANVTDTRIYPIRYSGPPLTNEFLRSELRTFCSSFDEEWNGSTCCGEDLLLNMNMRLAIMANVISNCTVCFKSITSHICKMMCSPKQSDILTAIDFEGKFITSVEVVVDAKWMKQNLNHCMRYGVLDERNCLLIDSTCYEDDECSRTSWLYNVHELVPLKLNPFYVIYKETTRFIETFDYRDCDTAIYISDKPSIDLPDYLTYPYGSMVYYLYVYGVTLTLFLLAIFFPEDSNANIFDQQSKHPSRIEMISDKYQRFLRRHFMQNATKFTNHAGPVLFMTFTLLLMMGFCNTYFSWYTWQDFERYATRDPEHRREREFVYKNFPMIGAQQVLYFKALNKSMRFLGPQHEVLWNIIRNVIKDVEGFSSVYNHTFLDFCARNPVLRKCIIKSYQHYGNAQQDYKANVETALTCMGVDRGCLSDQGVFLRKEEVFAGNAYDEVYQFDAFRVEFINFQFGRNLTGLFLRNVWEHELGEYLDIKKMELSKLNVCLTYMLSHEFHYKTFIGENSNEMQTLAFVSVVCLLAHIIYLSLILRKGCQPRVILSVAIILINVASITSGCGIMSLFGFKPPDDLFVMVLVVMAIGADNMVVLVLCYENNNPILPPPKSIGSHIGRTLCQIEPSLRVNALCSIVGCLIGYLATNDYAASLAVYFAVILTVNWLLQETCFISILSLDLRRQVKSQCEDGAPIPSCLDGFIRKHVVPLLTVRWWQVAVIILYLALLVISLNLIFYIKIGDDMDQYLINQNKVKTFSDFELRNSHIGPPVYFVVTGKIDFAINLNRKIIDDDYEWSLVNQIFGTNKWSYLLPLPVHSWWNDYQKWRQLPDCCRLYKKTNKYCQPDEKKSECYFCDIPSDNHKKLPTTQFYEYLAMFLVSKPIGLCPYGGLGSYDHLLRIKNDNTVEFMIEAFHPPLNTSEDHTRAVIAARNFCNNLTEMARKYLGELGLISQEDIQNFKIFPYSPFYDLYNQYVDIWLWAVRIMALIIGALFCIHFLVGGLNWLVSLTLVLNVSVITVQMIGIMHHANVRATENSLVVVMVCIGFAPRFVIFFIDRFATSMQKLKKERQTNAVQVMGQPLLLGVIGNKVFWLAPILMSKSNNFKIFVAMCGSGTLFGLLYVPTLIYFMGPAVNKASRLYVKNQTKEKLARTREVSM